MIVCHCKGKTCRDVKSAASCGARNVSDVGKACDAGTDCGGCVPIIEALLVANRNRTSAPPARVEKR